MTQFELILLAKGTVDTALLCAIFFRMGSFEVRFKAVEKWQEVRSGRAGAM